VRIDVPIAGSITIVNTVGARKGFSIQNVGAVDIFFSDDQRLLDSVSPANLPLAGHLLAAAATVPPPTVYPWFIGKLFARAGAPGALLEVIIYDVDLPCRG